MSNGIYFLDVLDTIDLPYKVIETSDQLDLIPKVHRHSRVYSRPSAVILSREVLNFLLPVPHFQNFLRGALDTRDIAYFVILSAYFLFLSTKVVESRKWS